MPTLHIIAAVAANGAIGRGGDLLYRIPADLRRFKEITMGHPIIMGRRTFESFPKGALPGRRNMVVSRNAAYAAPGAEVFASLEDAIGALADDDTAYIIGGGQIYAQAMPLAQSLIITFIDDSPGDADTFFPPIDQFEWQIGETSSPEPIPGTPHTHTLMILNRRPAR